MSGTQDNTYRPKSPDLSDFAPPPLPHLTRVPSYHQPDTTYPPGYNRGPRGSYDASPYFSPQTNQAPAPYFVNQPHAPSQTYSPQPLQPASLPSASPFGFTQQNQYANQINSTPQRAWYSPSLSEAGGWGREPTYYQTPNLSFSDPYDMARTRRQKANESHDPHDHDYNPAAYGNSEPPQNQHSFLQPVATPQPAASLDMIHSIDVRTKFPVARIKRIMQADEDVGKVAQATPTAVSKALELFMISLVSKGMNEAKLQNSKRITAQHLKTALVKDGQFDFLNEICESIPDEGSKKGRAKSEAQSEESSEEAAEPVRKKSKAGVKKRKAADNDDD